MYRFGSIVFKCLSQNHFDIFVSSLSGGRRVRGSADRPTPHMWAAAPPELTEITQAAQQSEREQSGNSAERRDGAAAGRRVEDERGRGGGCPAPRHGGAADPAGAQAGVSLPGQTRHINNIGWVATHRVIGLAVDGCMGMRSPSLPAM